MKHLLKFETQSAYDAVQSGLITPNVSLTLDNDVVHFKPYVEPLETRVVAKFNVTNTSSPTQIASATTSFANIEIDGVAQPSVTTGFTFSTTGEHTVKYTLTDPTSIGNNAFKYCYNLISVTIPNSVTSIGNEAFYDCNGLPSIDIPDSVTSIGSQTFQGCSGFKSVTLPSGVTSIGNYAFQSCNYLKKITSKALVAPTINTGTFYNVAYEGTLYVPSGSSGYNTWMSSGNYYLGRYNWTKVEQ